MRNLLAATTIALSTCASVALAQTAWVEIAGSVSVAPFSLTADVLDDMDVYAANGAKIGEVEDVLGAAAGTPSALAVDFDDDAGYGDRDDVIVPLSSVTMTDGKLVLTSDAAAVAAMERYDD